MSECYIIRHGVESNEGGITKKSKIEAKQFGNQILIDNGINNELIREQVLIVTSSIKRALETAESINEGFDNKAQIIENDSLSFGNEEEGNAKLLLGILKELPPYLIYIFVTHQPTAKIIAKGLGFKKKNIPELGNLQYYQFKTNKIHNSNNIIFEEPEIDYSEFEEADSDLVKTYILTDESGKEVDEIEVDGEIDYTEEYLIDEVDENEDYLKDLSSNIKFKELSIETKNNFFELDIPYHFKIEFYYYQKNLINKLFDDENSYYFDEYGILFELLGKKEMRKKQFEFENIKEKPFKKMIFLENLKNLLHNILLSRLNKST